MEWRGQKSCNRTCSIWPWPTRMLQFHWVHILTDHLSICSECAGMGYSSLTTAWINRCHRWPSVQQTCEDPSSFFPLLQSSFLFSFRCSLHPTISHHPFLLLATELSNIKVVALQFIFTHCLYYVWVEISFEHITV